MTSKNHTDLSYQLGSIAVAITYIFYSLQIHISLRVMRISRESQGRFVRERPGRARKKLRDSPGRA